MVVLLMSTLPAFSVEESICFGETRSGYLSGGVRLPRTGLNFSAYSDLGWIVGRTYVHSKVADVVLDGYKALETTISDAVFTDKKRGNHLVPSFFIVCLAGLNIEQHFKIVSGE